jgi:glycosyltransferase involved in cell wall biosynthesis
LWLGGDNPKEDLPDVLLGLAAVSHKVRARILLRIAGASRDAIVKRLGSHAALLESLSDCIQIVGRKDHLQALEEISQAEATVILRHNHLFARAGFSTKFVESLSCGVPVIANLTGDLCHHLHDGVEGVVSEAASPAAFATALCQFVSMSSDQRNTMREAARREAERSFDYRRHTGSVGQYLLEVTR